MGTRLVNVVIDSADPGKLAQWWATALGWRIVPLEDERDVVPPPGEPGVALTFVPVQDERVIKNRCLLYTSPSPRDQRGSRMPSSA